MKKKSLHTRYTIVAVVLVLVIVSIFLFTNQGGKSEITLSESTDFDKGEIKVAADGTKYIIDPNKIRSGGLLL